VDAHNGGMECLKGSLGESVDQWSQIRIPLMRSRFRIRIRIKVKVGSGSRIRIQARTWIRTLQERSSVIFGLWLPDFVLKWALQILKYSILHKETECEGGSQTLFQVEGHFSQYT
jgi:hypothetical protein